MPSKKRTITLAAVKKVAGKKNVGRLRRVKAEKLPPITPEQEEALEHWANRGEIDETIVRKIPYQHILSKITLEKRWDALLRVSKRQYKAGFTPYEVVKTAIFLEEKYKEPAGYYLGVGEDLALHGKPEEVKADRAIPDAVRLLMDAEAEIEKQSTEWTDGQRYELAASLFFGKGIYYLYNRREAAEVFFRGRSSFAIKGSTYRRKTEMLDALFNALPQRHRCAGFKARPHCLELVILTEFIGKHRDSTR